MSGDQRAELARRHLAEISAIGVEALPPSVLMREVAELRRLLGQVLGVLAEAQRERLTGAQLPVVLAALEDAAEWREQLAEECAATRGEYAAQAAAYRELARELGGQR